MITLLVVLAFILIFLIREWVVQQQPGLNLVGGLNGDLLVPHPNPLPAGIRLDGDDAQPPEEGDLEEPLVDPDVDPERENEDQPEQIRVPPGRARPLARPRRRTQYPPSDQSSSSHAGLGGREGSTISNTASAGSSITNFGDAPSGQEMFSFTAGTENGDNAARRPALLTRNALSKATEIQRAIEEDGRPEKQHWPGLEVFMKIWHRAGGTPEKVLEIIEAEGKTDELGWIVDAMKRLQDTDPHNPPTHLQLAVPAARRQAKLVEEDVPSNGSNESWLDVGAEVRNENQGQQSGQKYDPKSSSPEGSKISTDNVLVASRTHTPVRSSSYIDKGKQRQRENQEAIDKDEDQSFRVNFPIEQVPDSTEEFAELAELARFSSPSTRYQSDKDIPPAAISSTSRIESQQSIPDPTVGENPFGPEEPLELIHAPVHEDSENLSAASDSTESERTESVNPEIHVPVVESSMLDKISIWLWAVNEPEVNQEEEPQGDDEQILGNIADEAPFVPVVNDEAQPLPQPVGRNQDPNNRAREGEPMMMLNDVEAIEEGEDFEGVMELIGMQGPLTGLFQNGMFSAVLISATVGCGVWFPYIWGKLVLLLLANPLSLFIKIPLRSASIFADVFVDITLFFAGSFVYWIYRAISFLTMPLMLFFPILGRFNYAEILAATSRSIAEGGLERMARTIAGINLDYSELDLPIFSILSHEALNYLRDGLYRIVGIAWYAIAQCFKASADPKLWKLRFVLKLLFWPLDSKESLTTFNLIRQSSKTCWGFVQLSTRRFSLDLPARIIPIDPNLAHWHAGDRTIAILAGYGFFAFLGALYLKKRNPFSTSEQGKKIEGVIADMLQQAGGVLKVILIISIEMIAFPLYCGLLLDVALLPLFENVTLSSRINFTIHSPWTSIFVHWFVGTCYMFHFALFVSMCRKIMRTGVLCKYQLIVLRDVFADRCPDFIRDPDDPTFHPVRDVLERSVAAQLRKITFSALVYGALVIVCLGGVVWGLFFALDGVLPIHWSSNEPVLEFPVDLLFYNFLMPLAVRFFKPSDGLADMYTWWFRKCAKVLRLTWFMFGERRLEEEGTTRRPWTRILFQDASNQESPASKDTKPSSEDLHASDEHLSSPESAADSSRLVQSGRFVRAPASDQVRIPKGGPVFLEVNEANKRVDGQPEQETGQHSRNNTLFTQVYVPPYFRVRIGLFIVLIWLFAAFTGVSLTILPLIIGRMIFASVIPSHLRMNDVYAFSIGICILGSFFYLSKHARTLLISVLPAPTSTPISRRLFHTTTYLFRLFYMYTAFLVILPSLVALVMEAYLIVPLHSYLAPQETHIMHFVQDWTLGILYLKMLARLILHYSNSRPAGALRAVTRNGYLNPNAALATRAFVLPALVFMGFALVMPLGAGKLANTLLFSRKNAEWQALVYRFAYPAVAAAVGGIILGILLMKAIQGWRSRVRDEVYLVGERLHNFGERSGQRSRGMTAA
jgi:E3 ubiquitin-protein ligase MARCH6